MTKPSTDRFPVPQDVSLLPKVEVRQFIERLANAHGVEHRQTGLTDFTEAVTRLAGDEATLDSTGQLLVELNKRQIINDKQLARLATNYMAELVNGQM